jgi:exodeoxyribonuclease V beta subunit
VKSLDALTVPLAGTNLIEASAGTGKTYTITTLYPRLLVELKLPVNKILVVTYTNAATAELRTRIRRRLREALTALESEQPSGDEALDAFVRTRIEAGQMPQDRRCLLEALRSFDDASIFTIHGFCQRMLHENAFESRVPFDAQLLSDETLLRNEVVHDFWTRELHAASELLVRHLMHKKVTLANLSILTSKAVANPLTPVLPENLDADFSAAEANWRGAQIAAAAIWRRQRQDLIELLAQSPALNRNSYRVNTIRNTWPNLMDEVLAVPAPDIAARFPDFRKWTNAGLAVGAKKNATPPPHEFFDACARLAEADAELAAALVRRTVRLWLDLTEYARIEFRTRKEASRALSFEDLLHRFRAALAAAGGATLAAKIRERFGAALIDEFQDTDPVQYEIFRRIYHNSEAPLFLIGDPKQAIYAFRGADVFAYIAARSDAGESAHTLTVNRRSGPTLLRGINTLFLNARQQFVLASIPFLTMEAAPSSGDELGGTAAGQAPFEILFVPRTGQEGRGDRINKEWGKSVLPHLVAGEVVRFLGSGATLEGRKALPEDVAILCRTNDQARRMQRALRDLGVPCVLQSEASVFETPEASDLERVLGAIAEPGDSRAVRAALATPVLGLDAGALRVLNQDEEQWEKWVLRFHDWHALWLKRGFMPAFRRMLEDREVQPQLLGLVDGERRLTNLLHLGELIETAANEIRRGPFALVRWLALMRTDLGARAALGSEAAQIRLESDEKALRLVTIHKSKGLQYPIVYCPYLWDGALLREDDKKWVRFHDPDDSNRLKLDVGSDNIKQHCDQAALEVRAENMRLLYVALTRARHRCTVVWGAFRDAEGSPLGYLLHQPPGAGEKDNLATITAERILSLTDEEMRADLERVAKAARGAIEVREISSAPGTLYRGAPQEEPVLHCREFGRMLRTQWRTSSFSGLVSEAGAAGHPAEAEGADHDEAVDKGTGDEIAMAQRPATMLLADFPAGPRPGQLIHEIFERIDFCRKDRERLPQLVTETLATYSFEPRWQEPLCRAVDDVLTTPLNEDAEPLVLQRVPQERRINEMEFLFPVAEASNGGDAMLTGPRLAEVFARHASQSICAAYLERLRQLEFAPLAGYLKGFIDLVFEDRGRWYLVDYKSNLLGATPADYEPARLIEPMVDHHYFLQYHLYTVALHRHLTARLSGYDYDRHFGGVYYFFVRGMSPAHPFGCGVFRDRPERALIEGLSGLLSQCGGEP